MEVKRKNQINIFPDYETIDPDELWLKLISIFCDAKNESDFFLLSRVLHKIRFIVFNHFFPITSDRISAIIQPLFDFITTYPYISFKLQKEATFIFCKICSYPYRFPDIHLPMERVLFLYENLYNIKCRAYNLGPTDIQSFYPFFNAVSYFFNDSDADKLLSLYYDQIGFDEPDSLLALTMICRFLSPKQLHRVSKDFFSLIDASICSKITESIFFYLARASFFNPDFDWSPYYDLIFHAILCSMDPNIEIVGVLAGMEPKTDSYLSPGFDDNLSITLNGAFLLSIIIPGNYEVLSRLKNLIHLMKPLLTPKSKKGTTFSSFLNNLINFYHRRIRFLNFEDQSFNDDFVQIISPYLKTALFTAHESNSSIMRKTITKLCDLSIKVMKEEILLMSIDKMVDEEASSLSDRCFKILIKMLPILLQSKNISDNINLIPMIVENSFHSMKNMANTNSSFGISIICAISHFMYFPKNVDYMDHKEKNAVYSMTSRIVEFITLFLKGGDSVTGKPIILYEKMHVFFKIVAYFASFEDEVIIESFPRIYESINPDFQPHSICNIMRCLVMAKGGIVIDFFLPKFMNILKTTTISSNLKFYTNAICGLIYTSPTLINYLDEVCEITFNLMKTLEVKKLKNVSYLFLAIIESLMNVTNTDWKCSEPEEDVRNMWGKLYEKHEIVPSWFFYDKEVIIHYTKKFFDFVIPLIKENYCKCETKAQERLMKCYTHLLQFFSNRGSLEFIEPLPLERELNEYRSQLIETVIFLLSQNLCQTALTPIFNFLRNADDSSANIFLSEYFVCASNLGNKMRCSSKYIRFTTMAQRQSIYNSMKQCYVVDITDTIKSLIDVIFPYILSPYRSISANASYYIYCYETVYPKIWEEFIPNVISILEEGNYNEDEFRGYFQFVRCCLLTAIVFNPSLFSRYLKMIIQLKFEKKWNVSNLFSLSVNELERICYTCTNIYLKDENWQTFLIELPNLNRTIDIQHYYHIIQFCASRSIPISVELFEYLLLNVFNETQVNKYTIFMTLSNIFTKLKPISTKIYTKERPEFVDNICVGFFCKPDLYKSYNEPSVFEDIENPLLQCFFRIVDQKYIDELIPCCATLHPDKDDPPFISLVVYIWKGITQLLKYKVIDFLNDKLIGMLRLTPVHFNTACEIYSGVAMGIKHWTKEETENCESSFLKPFLLELFQHKFTDSTTNIFDYISMNRDPKRLHWLIEIVDKLLKEMDGIELDQVLTCCCCFFPSFGLDFDLEMNRIMIDIIIPKFSDFSNVILANIVELGYLVSCRDNLSVKLNNDHKIEWIDHFFTEIIDHEIDRNIDKVVKLLCTILIPWKPGNYRLFDHITSRLDTLFDHYSKITQKFEMEGKYVLLIAAEFQWNLYPEKLCDFLKKLLVILPQQKWRTKETAVGFLHLMTFLHIYQLDSDTIEFIFNEILPFFLFDDNDNIVRNAIAYLSLLVNMIYVDDLDSFAELILSEFHDDSMKMKKLGFLHTCGLLANLTVWEKCPTWLPEIFMEFENLNIKDNTLSQRFQTAMQEFWKRHHFIQIPEIEEYRDVIRRDYFA